MPKESADGSSPKREWRPEDVWDATFDRSGLLKRAGGLGVAIGASSAFGRLAAPAAAATPRSGGDLVFVTQGVPDSLDPALGFSNDGGFILIQGCYSGLVAYKRDGAVTDTRVVPVLAEALPSISRDMRTYVFKLRSGLRYSDGTPVKATDFKHGIERLFPMASPGTSFFKSIDGVAGVAKAGKGSIRGIVADDASRTVTFHLTHPDGSFLFDLASQFASPVPRRIPATDQSAHPIPATGPYYIDSYKPNQFASARKNPHFAPVAHYPAGHVDSVTMRYNVPPSEAASMLQNGGADWAMDIVSGLSNGYLTGDQIQFIRQRDPNQVHVYPTPYTKFIAMNATIPPFNDVKVRQAVNLAIDRNALIKIFGGFGVPAYELLPPEVPGYAGYHPYKGPDVARAKQLIKEAGAAGAAVTVNAESDPPWPNWAAYVQGVLNSIGLKADVKVLGDTPYYTRVQTTSTKWQIGHWDWESVEPDASAWFDVLVNSENIAKSGNLVLSRFHDPKLDSLVKRADGTVNARARTARWKAVERQVTEQALYAPYMYLQAVFVVSSRVAGVRYQANGMLSLLWPALYLK